jgi:hypothetical protein
MGDKKSIYYAYFNEKILPVIIPFEKERIKTVKKAVFVSVLFFLIGLIFAGLFVYDALYNVFNPLLLPVLLFCMYAFILKSIINIIVEGKEYQKRLIKTILPLFLEPVANFKSWPQDDIDMILNSELFPNFDSVEENFRIFGFYNDVSIRISDTDLILPVRGANKSYLFKGTLIKLELPRNIENHVILISKNLRKVNRYKQVNPHIEDLNKYLYMFAQKSSGIDFINEKFWTVLKRFGKLYTAKSFGLSYRNNVLLIALRQKRPLQFGFLFRSLLKPQNFDDLIERFTIIYDLIDEL